MDLAPHRLVATAALGVLAIAAFQGTALAKTTCFHELLTLPAPTGYRYPTENDVSDYWQFYRDEYGGQEASVPHPVSWTQSRTEL